MNPSGAHPTELQVITPKKLKLNPDNPCRTKASPEADTQLTANIKAIGLIQPLIVREDDGKLVVIAGNRRVKCSIAAGLTEIHVLVTKTEDNADPLRSLAENVPRAQMGPVDQWRAIEGLCGNGWSEEAIGIAFSMPVRTIRKLRLLAGILPAMLDRMAHNLPREEELEDRGDLARRTGRGLEAPQAEARSGPCLVRDRSRAHRARIRAPTTARRAQLADFNTRLTTACERAAGQGHPRHAAPSDPTAWTAAI